MDTEIVKALATLGPVAGAVTVVYLFLNYLRDRDAHLRDALSELTEEIEKLSEKLKKS